MKLFQNNKKVALFLLFTFFFSATILISSCSNKNKKNLKKTEITFSWWGKDFRNEYTIKGLNEFSEKFPQISVKPEFFAWQGYEKHFENQYNENLTADVMQINFDWLFKYSSDGNGFYNLFNLDDYIELFNFTQNDLSYGIMNGKLNAIPIAFNAIIPIFNKSIFDKYSLSVPKTWNELFNAAKIMQKDGFYPLGMDEKHLFLFSIAWFEQTYNKKFFTDNNTVNISENELEEFFKFVKTLFTKNVVFPTLKNFDSQMFSKNKIAGAVVWCNESSQFAEKIAEKNEISVLGNFISTPNAKESGWYLKPATMYAIKKDCKNPKEAAILINFLLNSKEMALLQKCEKGIPSSNKSLTILMEQKELETMEYDALMKIRYNQSNINSMLPIMENAKIISSFSKNLENYLIEKDSAKNCALDFYQTIQSCL